MLNYAYTVLASQMLIRAIMNGNEPTIGITRESRDGVSSFVFDIGEPEWAKVDRVILSFARTTVFHSADFVLRADGVVCLSPRLATTAVGLI